MEPNSFLKKLWVLILIKSVSTHSPGVSLTNSNKDLLEKGENSAVFSETEEIPPPDVYSVPYQCCEKVVVVFCHHSHGENL